MNIIIVDASQKKAAVRSRRILSKYLPTLGYDTYAGRMSEEGLVDLVTELKSAASRHSSIAIHRVVTRDRIELVTIIGNRDSFDGEGRCAFRTRTVFNRSRANSPLVELLLNLSTIAGLAHDLGKINLQFQEALSGQGGPQKVRHDVLGALLFYSAVVSAHDKELKTGWLEKAACDPSALFSSTIEADGTFRASYLQDDKFSDPLPLSSLSKVGLSGFLFSASKRKSHPEAIAVFFLALTHHHHIRRGRKEDGSTNEPSLWRHVHKSIPLLKGKNLKAPTTGLPWQDEKWCGAFKAACTNVIRIRNEHPDTLTVLTGNDLKTLTALLSHVMRPALIVADQAASTMQNDVLRNDRQGLPAKPGVLYANRFGNADLMGDTLSTHLISVGRKSRFLLQLLLDPTEGIFPSVSTPQPSTGSQLCSMPEPGSKFYWQRAAEDALQGIADLKAAPFFAVILSAPGSGKTAGGPRILSAACGGDLRFSLGVGRRSLTLQTGAAYEELLKFAPEDVATMVGDPAARVLYASDSSAKNALNSDREQLIAEQELLPQRGSECLVDDEPAFLFDNEQLLSSRSPGPWLNFVQPADKITSGSGFLSKKTIRLIDTPILVATIDHLAGAAALQRTKESHLLLRISNSDLILDELDDMSAHDLVTLGKLVHLYGVYGRRVVVMSGTINNYLAHQMYKCWHEGLKVHRELTGNQAPICLALFSNLTPPLVLREPSSADVPAALQEFCEGFSSSLAEQPIKSCLGILEMPQDNTIERPTWLSAVLRGALGLHQSSSTKDPRTGVRVSIGAIRFNTVRYCQQFARHLLNRPPRADEPEIGVICYHAKYPTLIRALLEKQLDSLLLRESSNLPPGQEFPEIPLLRKALNACHASNKQDFVLILCTTSIEETGRNHDLDWAISEPHSERSLAQLAGRVLRHRSKAAPAAPNVLLMSHTLNTLNKAGMPYGNPGVQGRFFSETETWLVSHPEREKKLARALQNSGLTFSSGDSTPTLRADQLLPVSTWQRSITPAPVLIAPETFEPRRLASLQHLEMRSALESSTTVSTLDALPASLQEYFQSSAGNLPLGLTSVHHEQVVFRDGDEYSRELCLYPREDLQFFVVNDGRVEKQFLAKHKLDVFKYPERDFFQVKSYWKEELNKLCTANGWGLPLATSILCKGNAPWGNRSEDSLLSNSFCFIYSFELGFSKID